MLKLPTFFSSPHRYLALTLLLALFLRVIWLDRVPPAMTHDELGYVYNAYSIAHTLRDVNGYFLPLNFDTGDPKSPVPIYLTAPIFGLFGLNQTLARLPYALVGVASVALLYLLSLRLSFSHRLSHLAAFFLAIMPWHIHISRLAYEVNFSLVLILLALVILAKPPLTRRHLIATGALLLLAFYSYHPVKVWFAPLIIVIAFFLHIQKLSLKTNLTFITSVFLAATLSFVLISQTSNLTTRFDSTTILDNQQSSHSVNFKRRTSLAPIWLQTLFNNKATYYFSTIRDHYFQVLSPQFLFTQGEATTIYTIGERGQLYWLDAPFLLLGLALVLLKPTPYRLLFLSILILSPLPSAISKPGGMSVRAYLATIPLAFLPALGLDCLLSFKPLRRLLPLILLVYLILLSSFSYQYFFRYPITASKALSWDERYLVEISPQFTPHFSQVILGSQDPGILWEYAFYHTLPPKVFRSHWLNPSASRQLQPGLNLVTDSGQVKEMIASRDLTDTLIITNFFDGVETPALFEIRDLVDSGSIWKLYTHPSNYTKVQSLCSHCQGLIDPLSTQSATLVN